MDEPIRRCRDLDERLTPYVDDEAGADERRAVDAHLTACPPCRGHAEAERVARDVIHERRDNLRQCAPDELRERCGRLRGRASAASPDASPGSAARSRFRLPSSVFRPSGVPRWVPLSLAATLLLAVGGVFLSGLNTGVQALATSLALDHAKCFQFKGDTSKAVDLKLLERTWEREQGWPIDVPATTGDEQLRLLTVRRCLSTDGRVAHAMYLWRGQPLSVFVLPQATAQERVFETMGRDAAIWSANGRTYAVLADGHPSNFTHIVTYVKTHAR
jgi:anti-sigma factor RsiW